MVTRRLFQDDSGYDPTAYDPNQQPGQQNAAYAPYTPATPQPAQGGTSYTSQATESARIPLDSNTNYGTQPVAQPQQQPTPAPPPPTPAPSSMMNTEANWLNIAKQFGTGPSLEPNISGYAGGNQYRGNLQPLVDAYNKQYGANAKVTGGDTVDFGDGYGPADVITGAGDLWYSEPGAHPAASGSGGSGTGSSANADSVAQLKAMIDAGMFGAPSAASLSPDAVNQVGQDPFSQIITDTLGSLIENNGQLPDTNGQVEALNLENARQQADRARQAEYSGVMSQLANRGLLPESVPGGQGGLALDALGRIEQNDIAPMMSAAVRSYMINDNNNASTRLMDALSQGTQRQSVLSNIALQTLSQNTAFNEFLAQFGLDRDKTLAALAQGQDSSLLMLLQNYLQSANTSSNGFI